jgi:hypothetical protein
MVMRDVGVPVDRIEDSGSGRALLWIAGVVVVVIVLAGLALLIFR